MGEFTLILSVLTVGLIALGSLFGYLWINGIEPPPWK